MNYPVRKVYITQEWGVNPQIYISLGLKGHNGIDLRTYDNNGNRAVSGDLIAPHDGKIIEARLDSDGYGWYYKIENNVEGSILGHNKELLFKVGDSVKEGQLIGYTDNTGWSTGSHVHWGYYRKPRNKADGYSGTTDPRPYINGSEPESGMMEIDKETFEKLVTKSTKYDEFVNAGFSEPQEIIDEIADLEKQVSDYAKKIEDQDKTIFTQKEDIRTLETDLAVTKIELSDCEGQIQEIPSLEEYTKGYKSTGRKTVEVYGNLTVETSFKKV